MNHFLHLLSNQALLRNESNRCDVTGNYVPAVAYSDPYFLSQNLTPKLMLLGKHQVVIFCSEIIFTKEI